MSSDFRDESSDDRKRMSSRSQSLPSSIRFFSSDCKEYEDNSLTPFGGALTEVGCSSEIEKERLTQDKIEYDNLNGEILTDKVSSVSEKNDTRENDIDRLFSDKLKFLMNEKNVVDFLNESRVEAVKQSREKESKQANNKMVNKI